MSEAYIKKRNANNRKYLAAILDELPPYMRGFFRSLQASTQPSTQLEQARDMQSLFRFFKDSDEEYKDLPFSKIPEEKILNMNADDVDRYISWMYQGNEERKPLSTRTINRRLSSLSNLFEYYMRNGAVPGDPVQLVRRPKNAKKLVNYLTQDDVANLLTGIWSMSKMLLYDKEKGEYKVVKSTSVYRENRKKYVLRDIAIIMTFLGTGIRVSELASLERSDIDLENRTIRYIRKGGNESRSVFSDEVKESLEMYLGQVPESITERYGSDTYTYLNFARENYQKEEYLALCIKRFQRDDEDFIKDMLLLQKGLVFPNRTHLAKDRKTDAVFISNHGKGITERGIQLLIKNYAFMYLPKTVTKFRVSPHLLRKTVAVALLRSCGRADIVKEVLGHRNPATMFDYYVVIAEEDIRQYVQGLQWMKSSENKNK